MKSQKSTSKVILTCQHTQTYNKKILTQKVVHERWAGGIMGVGIVLHAFKKARIFERHLALNHSVFL